ncbi:hypothetical protein [Pseudoduganella sp. OTU4001]|uniref:hypothetical protein n=1 Tax=Pseudoduganella sp. OTU4001 TaxID=3043854 RepID=UPI00313ED937
MLKLLLAATAQAATAGAHAAPLPCQPQTLLDPATIRERVILVGELHGTNEMPAFVSGLACSLLSQGRKVVLALEISSDAQPELDDYLVSDGGETVRHPLLASAFGKMKDGRGSEAMMAVIEQARVLRKAGAPLILAAMDMRRSQFAVPPGEKWNPATRDRIMAENVAALARSNPDAVVLSLTGNLHATKQTKLSYPPMGYLLSQQMPAFSLGLAHSGGSAWVCMGVVDGKLQCGETKMSGVSGGIDVGGFDREVRLGGITASPPAREGKSALGNQGGAQ